MAGVRLGMQIQFGIAKGNPIRPTVKACCRPSHVNTHLHAPAISVLLGLQPCRKVNYHSITILTILSGTVKNRPLPVVLPTWSLQPIWSGVRASMGAHSSDAPKTVQNCSSANRHFGAKRELAPSSLPRRRMLYR